MQPSHEWAPRGHSGFAAAFLSLLFPGLGHVYLGAYRRGLGFAAPPFLLGALVAGFAVRLDTVDIAGLIVQSWFLTGLFVVNLIALVYRAVAIVDAWSIARRLGGSGLRGSSGPGLGTASVVSIAGLGAVLLVMALAHVAVARYDLLAAGTLDCVFDAAAGCNGSTSGEPTEAPGSGGATVGPAVSGGVLPPWDGKERLNIVLSGADEQDGGHNTDTLITVSIDPRTNEVVMFTLPRDTVDVPVPPGPARQVFGSVFRGKINQWFASVRNRPDLFPGDAEHRGYNGVKAILGELYGLDVRYYVEVNFAGFKKVVDALGGVTVNVQVPVVDDDYPGSKGNRQRIYIQAGTQHMSGAEALVYARSRHASSDFDRGARQQRVLVSLRRQTDLARILPSLDALSAAISSSIRTDIPRELVPQLLSLAQRVDARSIRSVIFTPPFYQQEFLSSPRGYIIVPHVDRIRAAVQEAFKVDPGFAEARDALAAEGASVWVLNGSGRQGQASTVAAYLEYLGIAATAPLQKPDTTGLSVTTVRAYNGAESEFPLTMAALAEVFGVQVVAVTDSAIRADFLVITSRETPELTPPPLP
jgi:LCP family protein required for cell wall assembly